MTTEPSARLRLELEPTQIGYVLGALGIVQRGLGGPQSELTMRELTELARDIREQVQEQSK